MTSQNLLDALQQEFIEIVNEIAEDSVTIANERLFDEVQDHWKSLHNDRKCDEAELSFFEKRIRDHQACEAMLSLKKQIKMEEQAIADSVIPDVDSGSDDSGTAKPYF